tara:strand:+ start:39 stop:1097 length:1059 start_codon:yes stop_codon:yes gene_type:complete
MRIIFRVDSSNKIGAGHINRCIYLAKELRTLKKAKIIFFCKKLKGNFNYLIKKNNFDLITFPEKKMDSKDLRSNHFKRWRNDIQKNEINFIKKKIKKNVSFIFVDHYGLDFVWEKGAKELTNKVVVIDDIGDKKHFCNYYINFHNYLSRKKLKMTQINKNTKILNNYRYTLVSKKIKLRLKKNKKKNIFIYLGSTDKKNMTYKLIKCLKNKHFKKFKFKVLIGVNNDNFKKIYNLTKNSNNISILKKQIKNFNNLYKKIDNTITAGGVTMYESILFGFKPLVIMQNKFQEKSSNDLAEKRMIKKINFRTNKINEILSALNTNKNFYEHRSLTNSLLRFKNGTKNIINYLSTV